MFLRILATLVTVVTLVQTIPASALDSRLDRVDDRAELIGWEAVGRLDMIGSGTCTGTLIAPDLVLTAAHCVYDRSGSRLPAERIVFSAGLRDGKFISQSRGFKVAVAAGYVPNGEVTPDMIRRDVALIKLERGIAPSLAKPFTIHNGVRTGGKIMVASYGRGRNAALSIQRSCNILSFRKSLLTFDCDITYGSSGAPVLAYDGIHLRVLSVVSSMERGGGVTRGFGMEIPQIVAGLRRELAGGGRPMAAAPVVQRTLTVGGSTGARRVGGAKFMSAKD